MLPGHLDRRVPETLSPEQLAAVNRNLRLDEAAVQGQLGPAADAAPLPRLAQVAGVAAFLASNQAAAVTGTFVNLTSGTFPSWQVNSVQDVVAAASSLDPGPGLGAGRAAVGVGW
jgi:hypothetical protein